MVLSYIFHFTMFTSPFNYFSFTITLEHGTEATIARTDINSRNFAHIIGQDIKDAIFLLTN